MKDKLLTFALVFSLVAPAFAQQAPTPDATFWQNAVNALQNQRNTALDEAAAATARIKGLQDQLAKAEARIKELESKSEPASKDKK